MSTTTQRNVPAIVASMIRNSIEYDGPDESHETRGSADRIAFETEFGRRAEHVAEHRERDGTHVTTYVGRDDERRWWTCRLIDTGDAWNVSQYTTFGRTDDP